MLKNLLSRTKQSLARLVGSKPEGTSTSALDQQNNESRRQDQTAIDGSTAIQAAGNVVLNTGVTLTEVRQIAMDIYRANFYELSGLARETAEERAVAVTEAFLAKLQQEHPEGFGQANDPGFQHALYTVQKEHARTGDTDLSALLVDLLVDRTKHTQRDFMQIVLDESLSTAPKLTEQQLASLALVFLFRYTGHNGVATHAMLGEYLDKFVQPFASNLAKSQASFQHLEFAGCGSNTLAQASLETIFSNSYQGLFVKGFDETEAQAHGVTISSFPGLFVHAINDPQKIQVAALTKDQLDERLTRIGVSPEDQIKIKTLFTLHKMSSEEIRAKCIEIRGYMELVFDVWSESRMHSFTLTSVGMAIGHANIKRIAGSFSDLSLWIT